jgi:hypothetical protein
MEPNLTLISINVTLIEIVNNVIYGVIFFLLDLFLDLFESKWLYEYKI